VSRLILETFVGPAPTPKHHAAHRDGKVRNNTLSNLSWKTAKENCADKVRHGTVPVRGTLKQLKEILAMRAAGLSYTQMSEKLQRSRTRLCAIAKRQSWLTLWGQL
jgi:hypothetical protein